MCFCGVNARERRTPCSTALGTWGRPFRRCSDEEASTSPYEKTTIDKEGNFENLENGYKTQPLATDVELLQ